jgi:hypothetical protein
VTVPPSLKLLDIIRILDHFPCPGFEKLARKKSEKIPDLDLPELEFKKKLIQTLFRPFCLIVIACF